jgi:hypothetical protein
MRGAAFDIIYNFTIIKCREYVTVHFFFFKEKTISHYETLSQIADFNAKSGAIFGISVKSHVHLQL